MHSSWLIFSRVLQNRSVFTTVGLGWYRCPYIIFLTFIIVCDTLWHSNSFLNTGQFFCPQRTARRMFLMQYHRPIWHCTRIA